MPHHPTHPPGNPWALDGIWIGNPLVRVLRAYNISPYIFISMGLPMYIYYIYIYVSLYIYMCVLHVVFAVLFKKDTILIYVCPLRREKVATLVYFVIFCTYIHIHVCSFTCIVPTNQPTYPPKYPIHRNHLSSPTNPPAYPQGFRLFQQPRLTTRYP